MSTEVDTRLFWVVGTTREGSKHLISQHDTYPGAQAEAERARRNRWQWLKVEVCTPGEPGVSPNLPQPWSIEAMPQPEATGQTRPALTHHQKGAAYRQLMGELGRGCTYEQFFAEAEKRGLGEPAQSTFAQWHKRLFPDTGHVVGGALAEDTPAAAAPAPTEPAIAVGPTSAAKTPVCLVAELVELTALVKRLGGIARVRQLLDAAEEFARQL